MSSYVTVKIELRGLQENIKVLEEVLDKKNFNAIVGAAMRKALNETIVKPARAALPYSAQTRAGISIVRNKKVSLGYIAGIIARKRDKKNPDALPAGVILRFLEGGTKVREVNGASRGKIEGNPIASSIISNAQAGVTSYMEKDFEQALLDQMEKKLNKLKK
jgi:hypothetical protein